MVETAYCYRCATHHPKETMRLHETKGGKRWRCINSIEATKKNSAERDAYGRQISTINKAETQGKKSWLSNDD